MKPSLSFLLASSVVLGGSLAIAKEHNQPEALQLKYEHAGSIFKTVSADSSCVNGVVHAGEQISTSHA